MASIITQSIDVTKITKSKLRDGKYLDITTNVEDATNKFGQNVSTYESQTKEERGSKTPKNYLGNGKEFVFNDNGGTQTMATETVDDDLPF